MRLRWVWALAALSAVAWVVVIARIGTPPAAQPCVSAPRARKGVRGSPYRLRQPGTSVVDATDRGSHQVGQAGGGRDCRHECEALSLAEYAADGWEGRKGADKTPWKLLKYRGTADPSEPVELGSLLRPGVRDVAFRRAMKSIHSINVQQLSRKECRCAGSAAPPMPSHTSSHARIAYLVTLYDVSELPMARRLHHRLYLERRVLVLIHIDRSATLRSYTLIHRGLASLPGVVVMDRLDSVPTPRWSAGLALVNEAAWRVLFDLRDRREFKWDYVINLTPTTYPVVGPQAISAYFGSANNSIFLECKDFHRVADNRASPTTATQLNRLLDVVVSSERRFRWRFPPQVARPLPEDACFAYGSAYYALPYQFVRWALLSPLAARVSAFLMNANTPDELLVQSLVQSSPFGGQQHETVTYVTWPHMRDCPMDSGIGHPCTLTKEDAPAIMTRAARRPDGQHPQPDRPILFVRKVHPVKSLRLLDLIDDKLLKVKPWQDPRD